MTPTLAIGLMSGTSMDGVDGVLAEFRSSRLHRILATARRAYTVPLRAQMLALSTGDALLSPDSWCELDQAVAHRFADTALALLRRARLRPPRVRVIGSHGQTLFHDTRGRRRATLQLGDPNIIAARSGVQVVADLRRRDCAEGGQGAPLAPAFHAAQFSGRREARCVLNLGGLANVTLLPAGANRPVTGFDTGPANALMDEWAQVHLGRPYDAAGRWAAGGQTHAKLLAALRADPWFRRRPPKSTGRGKFNLAWVRARHPAVSRLDARDVQRTFCELSATTIADALHRHGAGARRVIVCGGGIRNLLLMRRIAECVLPAQIGRTDEFGVPAPQVEAAAFAWLALQTLRGRTGNLPSVTGAGRAAVLGGIYPA